MYIRPDLHMLNLIRIINQIDAGRINDEQRDA